MIYFFRYKYHYERNRHFQVKPSFFLTSSRNKGKFDTNGFCRFLAMCYGSQNRSDASNQSQVKFVKKENQSDFWYFLGTNLEIGYRSLKFKSSSHQTVTEKLVEATKTSRFTTVTRRLDERNFCNVRNQPPSYMVRLY